MTTTRRLGQAGHPPVSVIPIGRAVLLLQSAIALLRHRARLYELQWTTLSLGSLATAAGQAASRRFRQLSQGGLERRSPATSAAGGRLLPGVGEMTDEQSASGQEDAQPLPGRPRKENDADDAPNPAEDAARFSQIIVHRGTALAWREAENLKDNLSRRVRGFTACWRRAAAPAPGPPDRPPKLRTASGTR